MAILSGLVAALFAAAPGGGGAPPVARITTLSIRERIVIRVPALRGHGAASPWRERRHDRCVPMTAIAGAGVMRPDAVDFILRGGQRVRGYVEDSCPSLDYYAGFYVLPTADGLMCADRDAIRDRSGNACEITRFRALEPRK